ncbi:glycosyltransferase family 2 protein [Amylibacter sp.]|nr:glycosyltransferase family 2 protein [Amylibacter sp.]
MARSKLAIVIPAYNEQKTIGNIVKSLINYGTVIVVDDGSEDGTSNIAHKNGAIVVKHNVNQGYDNALNSGFKKASTLGSKIIITFDADGQHSVSMIDNYLLEIEKGADVVVGIRNRKARLSEAFFSYISSLLWNIDDPQCGMKAYRSCVYDKLGHFDSYGSIGTELCIFAAKNNFQIAQVIFEVHQRVDSPRFGTFWSANWKIFRALVLGILKY